MQVTRGGKQLRADINVTPMIDLLLVLLVIFMVLTPLKSVGLDALIRQQSNDQKQEQPPPLTDIVITVRAGCKIDVNQQDIAWIDLHQRLQQIYNMRPNGVVFIRAEKDLEFSAVAEVIDEAKSTGLDRIALMGAI